MKRRVCSVFFLQGFKVTFYTWILKWIDLWARIDPILTNLHLSQSIMHTWTKRLDSNFLESMDFWRLRATIPWANDSYKTVPSNFTCILEAIETSSLAIKSPKSLLQSTYILLSAETSVGLNNQKDHCVNNEDLSIDEF